MDASDITKQKINATVYINYISAIQKVQPTCVTGSCAQMTSSCILNYPDYATKDAVMTGFSLILNSTIIG
jgi:hypothetical protein